MKDLKLDDLDLTLLEYLLDEHIDEGSYFGVKKHHYKRCKKLMVKLQTLNKE